MSDPKARHLNNLPARLRATGNDPIVHLAANVIEELCASGDLPLDEVLEGISFHCDAARRARQRTEATA